MEEDIQQSQQQQQENLKAIADENVTVVVDCVSKLKLPSFNNERLCLFLL